MPLPPVFSRFRAAFSARAGVSLWMPAAVAITFFVFLALDPFGMGAASHLRSEQATLRIVSPFYSPSRKVTVVLIDDEYLRARNIGWPLKYAEQGRLFRQILSVAPAALVVDLVYPHRHGESDATDQIHSLIDPIRGIATTPVIFTALARDPSALPASFEFCGDEPHGERAAVDLLDRSSVQPELLSLIENDGAKRFQLAYVRWSGCGARYPLMLGGDAHFATPAFAAYRAFCERYPSKLTCAGNAPAGNAEDYIHPMIVRAGAYPPPEQAFAYGKDACQKPAPKDGDVPSLARFGAALRQLALGVFKDPRTEKDNDIALPCPAVTVVPMSSLSNATREDWSELMHDKVVWVGANIAGIPDVIDSPVHGQIPGVVWHAMALDNLLTLGPGYLADRHETLQRVLGFVLVILFAYSFPFIVWLLEHRRFKRILVVASLALWIGLAAVYFRSGDVTAASTALAIGVGFDLMKPASAAVYLFGIVIAAIGSLIFLSHGWPPGNWLGLVFVLIAFSHTVKPYYHPEERQHFPHRLSILRHGWLAVRARSRDQSTTKQPRENEHAHHNS